MSPSWREVIFWDRDVFPRLSDTLVAERDAYFGRARRPRIRGTRHRHVLRPLCDPPVTPRPSGDMVLLSHPACTEGPILCRHIPDVTRTRGVCQGSRMRDAGYTVALRRRPLPSFQVSLTSVQGLGALGVQMNAMQTTNGPANRLATHQVRLLELANYYFCWPGTILLHRHGHDASLVGGC